MALIHPDGAAGAGIEGEGAVVLRCGVEDAIDYERRGFEFPRGGGLVDPFGYERVCVFGVDLVELAEAAPGVIAGIGQPVLGFLGGVEQAVESYLSLCNARRDQANHNEPRAQHPPGG